MADTIKILAQAAPAAATLTNIYTVPASTSALVSSVIVCNQSSTDTTFRLSLAVAAQTDTQAQYLYYDLPLPAKDSYTATIGITLAATDVLRGYSPGANTSWQVLGIQVT